MKKTYLVGPDMYMYIRGLAQFIALGTTGTT